MPFNCCVPFCNGNYKSGPRVSVFSFPKPDILVKQWLLAIQRKDYIPNKHSRVCELHFEDSDFKTEAEAYDPATGLTLTAPLYRRRLQPNAIPSIFQNYPSSVRSNIAGVRLSPNSKKQKRENDNVLAAIQESIASANAYNEERMIKSADDVLKCFQTFDMETYWSKAINESEICVFRIETKPHPNVVKSIVISNLILSAYYKNLKLKKIGKYNLPYTINHYDQITEILGELKAYDCEVKEEAPANLLIEMINSVQNEDNKICLQFLTEQILLNGCPKNNLKYSSDTIVFSTQLRSISPHAYRFIRNSGKIIIPHPETLRVWGVSKGLNISPGPKQEYFHQSSSSAGPVFTQDSYARNFSPTHGNTSTTVAGRLLQKLQDY